MKKLKLNPGDYIITTYAQPASGPGWGNTPVWVLVKGADGKIREECLQPDQQTRDMVLLYPYSARAHRDMCSAVEQCVKRCNSK